MSTIEENYTHTGNGLQEKNGDTVTVQKCGPPVDMKVALTANDAGSVPKILRKINSFGDAPSVDNLSTRLSLLAQARDLVRALETPRETMIKHCWAQVCF